MIATFHDLRDTSIVITGGGNGIGAALTEVFLAQGAKVANDVRHDAMAITPDIWEGSQAINRKAYFFACQKAAQMMATKGAIINYSSITHMLARRAWSPMSPRMPASWE